MCLLRKTVASREADIGIASLGPALVETGTREEENDCGHHDAHEEDAVHLIREVDRQDPTRGIPTATGDKVAEDPHDGLVIGVELNERSPRATEFVHFSVLGDSFFQFEEFLCPLIDPQGITFLRDPTGETEVFLGVRPFRAFLHRVLSEAPEAMKEDAEGHQESSAQDEIGDDLTELHNETSSQVVIYEPPGSCVQNGAHAEETGGSPETQGTSGGLRHRKTRLYPSLSSPTTWDLEREYPTRSVPQAPEEHSESRRIL